MKFIVRTNCEYSIQIDDETVETEEQACTLAEKIPYTDWGQAWAEYTAEPDDHDDDTPLPPGVYRNP